MCSNVQRGLNVSLANVCLLNIFRSHVVRMLIARQVRFVTIIFVSLRLRNYVYQAVNLERHAKTAYVPLRHVKCSALRGSIARMVSVYQITLLINVLL